jgi:SAM-dependent methyltransferase
LDKRIFYLQKYGNKKSLVLDAGSGNFDFAKYSSGLNDQLICVDIIRPPATILPKYNFIQSTIESLPFRANCFDFIYCFSVFQYVNEEIAMEEFYRVLKPEGKLLLTVPTALSPFRLLRDLEVRFKVYDKIYIPQFAANVYHYYTNNRIKKLMAHRFELVELVGYRYNFMPRFMIFMFNLTRLYKITNFLRQRFVAKEGKNTSRKESEDHLQLKTSDKNENVQQCKEEIVRRRNINRRRVCFLGNFSYHYIIVARKKSL